MFYTTSNSAPEATSSSSSDQISLVSIMATLFRILAVFLKGILTLIRFVFSLIATGFAAFVSVMEQFGNPSQNRPS